MSYDSITDESTLAIREIVGSSHNITLDAKRSGQGWTGCKG